MPTDAATTDVAPGVPVEPQAERPRRGRGRRPSGEVRAEILEAAGRLLLTEGVAGFAIERVAALAGTSKTSIYKGWSSRGALAVEAYARSVDATLALDDTGDLEHDLVTHLTTFTHLLGDTRAGRVTAELLGAAQSDPALRDAFQRSYLEPRRAAGTAALRRAQQRGQLRDDVDLEVLSDQLWGACMYRLMTGLHPLDPGFVRPLVENVLRGVRTVPGEPARRDARGH